MVNCCIYGCRSRSERLQPNITFHRFPNEPFLRNKWTECTGRVNWHPSRHSRMCSRHFEAGCIRQKLNSTNLNPCSIPTLFIQLDDSSMTVSHGHLSLPSEEVAMEIQMESTMPENCTEYEAMGSVEEEVIEDTWVPSEDGKRKKKRVSKARRLTAVKRHKMCAKKVARTSILKSSILEKQLTKKQTDTGLKRSIPTTNHGVAKIRRMSKNKYIQNIKNVRCATCFSCDRKLYPLKEIHFFRTFLPELQFTEDDLICYECEYFIKKMHKFRKKVLEAQALIEQASYGTDMDTVKGLSQLKSTDVEVVALVSYLKPTPEMQKIVAHNLTEHNYALPVQNEPGDNYIAVKHESVDGGDVTSENELEDYPVKVENEFDDNYLEDDNNSEDRQNAQIPKELDEYKVELDIVSEDYCIGYQNNTNDRQDEGKTELEYHKSIRHNIHYTEFVENESKNCAKTVKLKLAHVEDKSNADEVNNVCIDDHEKPPSYFDLSDEVTDSASEFEMEMDDAQFLSRDNSKVSKNEVKNNYSSIVPVSLINDNILTLSPLKVAENSGNLCPCASIIPDCKDVKRPKPYVRFCPDCKFPFGSPHVYESHFRHSLKHVLLQIEGTKNSSPPGNNEV